MSIPKRSLAVIEKYLARYAEPEAAQALTLCANIDTAPWQHCLCLPVYDEPLTYLQRLLDFIATQNHVLTILVVNQPMRCTRPTTNPEWLQQLSHTLSCASMFGSQHLFLANNNNAILCIDRFSDAHRIADKQGVGLARKIASDTALALFTKGHHHSRWAHCCDADTQLPADYFSAIEKALLAAGKSDEAIAACLYPFTHVASGNATINHAHARYEERLQHYVDGLAAAGSPYAFHTLGSILALNLSHYAAARGFPRRNGAEDFYLLNKLKKLGQVLTLDSPVLRIDCRASARAPFGTGVATSKLSAAESIDDEPLFYHPDIFNLLGELLTWQKSLARSLATDASDEPIAGGLNRASVVKHWAAHLQDFLQHRQQSLAPVAILQSMGFGTAINQCLQSNANTEQLHYTIDCWFDGFRTLKFIHALRDHGFHDLSWHQLQESVIADNTVSAKSSDTHPSMAR